MSSYEAPDAARISYRTLDHPAIIARLVIAGVAITAVIVGVLLAPRGHWRDQPIPGVVEACNSAECISPRQLITANEARALKRRLGGHALIVDIAPVTEGTAYGSDAKAPFVESETPAMTTFNVDFGQRVDDALRAAGMGHDEPVVLLSTSLEHSTLAALLLQERGYTAVLVVRD
jgi:hypothetical protein